MPGLLERLGRGEVLLADGAMGTMLFERGLAVGQCPESFNLEHPEILREIAELYLNAGSDIIQTNTFGGSPIKLAQYELDSRTEEVNIAAIRAVRDVVGDRAYVSASCGPCGAVLKPYGDVEPDDVLAGFERQIRALVAGGVDMICVETMIDLTEAKLAIEAARSISPTTPIAATMTFDPTPRGFFTVMGVSVKQAATGLSEAGADIVGTNCGNGIDNMIEIAEEFRKNTTLPVIIQSNAGLPETIGDKLVYSETPEYVAEKCKELLAAGVNIIGGCCGTTPEHIAAIRKTIDEYTVRNNES
jgi:5-methyltetrahydrofolate--homocysteine methyltransferase